MRVSKKDYRFFEKVETFITPFPRVKAAEALDKPRMHIELDPAPETKAVPLTPCPPIPVPANNLPDPPPHPCPLIPPGLENCLPVRKTA